MRRGPGRPRRSILALAVVAGFALAGGLLPQVIEPAAAALNTPIPADSTGLPADVFFDTDALFVLVVSDFRGGTVCVVSAAVESPEGGCAANKAAWSTPNRILGIGTQYVLIEGPDSSRGPLRVGDWRLLSENSFGEGTSVGGVFTVLPCDIGAGCDPTLGAAAAQAFKDSVGDMRTGSEVTCLMLKAKDLKDNPAPHAGRALDKVPGIEAKTYSSGGFGATVVSTPAGAFGFGFSYPSFGNPGEAKAMEILQELTCTGGRRRVGRARVGVSRSHGR